MSVLCGGSELPITPIYTSCACNRSPACVDWGCNGLIIYAGCNSVLVYKPEDGTGGGVVQTLISHKKLVTSVHWIYKHGKPETELISTSADNTAIIWAIQNSEFTPIHILSGHANVVKTAKAVYVDDSSDDLLVATASADSTAKIWRRKNSAVECVQTISFGNGFALTVDFSFLNEHLDPLLVIGRDDFCVHLFVLDENNQFSSCAKLSGHEDWVQGLDIIKEENGNLWLATASQDSFIRIWKIFVCESGNEKEDSLPTDLKVKETTFDTFSGKKYKVLLESVLSCHDNFVYSVQWGPPREKVSADSLRLLSSSMDRTMIIWEPDHNANLWMDEVRVGEVGGNVLGFYGGVFSPDGKKILAHGFHGAIHIWSYSEDTGFWNPSAPFGGHFASVRDIAWDPDGAYLLSCSHDQTTRLHAAVFRAEKKISWHEIARPQIHGYDIVCLAVLDRFKFVSGSDEKILRVFQAPKIFAENLEKLCHVDTSSYLKDSLPEGASVPALGLSNKAVYEEDLIEQKIKESEKKHAKDMNLGLTFSPTLLKDPPTEEVLLQNTLWPEDRKLYGHPYEIFSVASNNKRTILASSCKAAKPEHAAIMLWNTSSWKRLGNLVFHSLSVTQMEFSPNDEFLLSVSRDRMWVLYQHVPSESPPYKKVANLDKKSGVHTRIIWSCSWSHDSLYFATASRDKKVAIWEVNTAAKEENGSLIVSCVSQLDVEDSATAVTFAPCFSESGRYIIAIGLDNGKIFVYTWKNQPGSENWNLNYCLHQRYAHHMTVNRLNFSPVKETRQFSSGPAECLLLASCGSDYLVRINALHCSEIH